MRKRERLTCELELVVLAHDGAELEDGELGLARVEDPLVRDDLDPKRLGRPRNQRLPVLVLQLDQRLREVLVEAEGEERGTGWMRRGGVANSEQRVGGRWRRPNNQRAYKEVKVTFGIETVYTHQTVSVSRYLRREVTTP